MTSTGKKLEKKYPAINDSGLAYHIMMFINREETSINHYIGDDFLWETMAAKKIFRGKTAESLKNFFRDKFWGNYKKYGISKNTYKILLQKLKINYLKSNSERLELLEKLFCSNSVSFNLEDISRKEFWGAIFFLHPILFDPFACWDKNLVEYQMCLTNMPQLLKRKLTCPKAMKPSLNELTKENDTDKQTVTVEGSANCGRINKTVSGSVNVSQEFRGSSSPRQAATSFSPVYTELGPPSQQSPALGIQKMEVCEETESVKQLETEVDKLKRDGEEPESTVEGDEQAKCRTGIDGISPGLKQEYLSRDSYRNDVTKNLALPSAMNLLAAKKDMSVMVLYNHASTFFRVVTVMAKAAQSIGLDENIVVDDWHLLSDKDAQTEFEKLAFLDVITKDTRFDDISTAFVRLCVSFGRVLQLEKKLLNSKKKQQTLTEEKQKE